MKLPWAFWDSPPEAISPVAEKFVPANGYPTTAVPDMGKAPTTIPPFLLPSYLLVRRRSYVPVRLDVVRGPIRGSAPHDRG